MKQRPGDHVVYRPRSQPNLKAEQPPPLPPPRMIKASVASNLASRPVRYGATLAVLGVTTAAMWPFREIAGLLNIGLVYLMVVIGVTVFGGRWAGVVASFLGFSLLNYFFVPPYLTFAIADVHNILALFVFLGVSLLISWLIAGAQEQARQAQLRAEDISRLYELNQAITGAHSAGDVLAAVAQKVHEVFEAQSCWILLPDERGQLAVAAQAPPDAPPPNRDEMSLASWAYTQGSGVGRDSSAGADLARQGASSHSAFIPLQAAQRAIGALAVVGNKGRRPFTPAERMALATFAGQAAVALERLYLLKEAERAEVLARTDELKSALMSAVSHDLRTPLASIMASVTSLMEPDIKWDDETQRDFLQGTYDEARRLNKLVGNLLDMSRIEGGALHPETDWYSIGEVIEAVVERLETRTGERPVTTHLEPGLPLLLLDFAQIDQVITNILENAIRYTPPGTPITVRARRGSDTVEIEVEDAGPGVPREHIPYLFDKFYQVDRGSQKGTGLGLAISKGLVEAHGGRIWASNRPGGGLKVSFTLPLEKDKG